MAKARITAKTKKVAKAKAKPRRQRRETPAQAIDFDQDHDDVFRRASGHDPAAPPIDSYLSAPPAAAAVDPNDIERHSNDAFQLAWERAGYAATMMVLSVRTRQSVLFTKAWLKAVPVMLNLGGAAAIEAAEHWLSLARSVMGDPTAETFMKRFHVLAAAQAKKWRKCEIEQKKFEALPMLSFKRAALLKKMNATYLAASAASVKACAATYFETVEAEYRAWSEAREAKRAATPAPEAFSGTIA